MSEQIVSLTLDVSDRGLQPLLLNALVWTFALPSERPSCA